MRILFFPFLIALAAALPDSAHAQLFTMGEKCNELINQGKEALANESYSEALAIIDNFSAECKTKDAKRIGAAARAEAYNGLGEYEKAIAAADEALRLTKNRSLGGHFQKGVALHNLGDQEGARNELNEVIALTEKNQNTQEKASNYALMAALYDRQFNKRDSALLFLEKAMEMDPGNANFWIQKGDMFAGSYEYDKAFEAYDQAVAMGRTDLEMYITLSNTGLKMLEHKYGTTKAQELRGKMTEAEKNRVCPDLKKALELGWNQMDKDMFAALVCQ